MPRDSAKSLGSSLGSLTIHVTAAIPVPEDMSEQNNLRKEAQLKIPAEES